MEADLAREREREERGRMALAEARHKVGALKERLECRLDAQERKASEAAGEYRPRSRRYAGELAGRLEIQPGESV